METLLQAYQNMTSSEQSEPGESPQAIAKVMARLLLTNNCYTPPPSLGATTELVASPFDVNPKMNHYCAAFAQDAEFGARSDTFSFIWQASCHPEPSDAQVLKTLRWALACASIQTEPLPVTLLLPERPKSAFTSLLSHPSVLHLTIVQNMSFLDPTS